MTTKFSGRITLLVLCGAFLTIHANVSAQTQNGFASYLQQLPGAPKSPADADLVSASAQAIENPADIDKIERQMSEYLASLQGPSIGTAVKPDEHTSTKATTKVIAAEHVKSDDPVEAENVRLELPNVRNTPQSVSYIAPYDSCRSIVKRIQTVSNEYLRLFSEVELNYVYAMNVAEDKARDEQKREVCGSNSDCLKRHHRNRNLGIVGAQHMRIDKSAELTSSEIGKLVPLVKEFDRLMPKHLSTVNPATTRRELNGFSSYVMNVVLGMAEHIKLNRVHIAECARLLQDAR